MRPFRASSGIVAFICVFSLLLCELNREPDEGNCVLMFDSGLAVLMFRFGREREYCHASFTLAIDCEQQV